MTLVDTVLRDGLVYDGSGEAPFIGDIAMDSGGVTAVGTSLAAAGRQEINCSGLSISPGFIDVHAHDDIAALQPGGLDPKIRQGVTASIVGNCGHGAAPVGDHGGSAKSYSSPVLGEGPEIWPWRNFSDYVAALEASNSPITVMPLVPHGTARISVMGFDARPATTSEKNSIVKEVRRALEAGAGGVSMGLMYAPACFAATDELIAVAEQAAVADRVLAVHIRAEGSHAAEALEEVRHIAASSGAKLHISHLKCTGAANHGRMPEMIRTLDTWRGQGIDVTADVYPYTAGSTTVCGMLPDWALSGGVEQLLQRLEVPEERLQLVEALRRPWQKMENHLLACGPENIVLIGLKEPSNRQYEGKSVLNVAAERGITSEEALISIICEERGRPGVVQHQGAETDLVTAMRWKHTMVGSDGLPSGEESTPHPRLYGTFPRVLGRYVRERNVLPVEEAIHRMTSMPARRFGLTGHGEIRQGGNGNVLVFDPNTIIDTSTYSAPRSAPAGIRSVWSDGHLIYSNEQENAYANK